MILVQPDPTPGPGGGLGLHARVSSPDQRADLDRQVGRLTQWPAAAQAPVVRVEAEIASGMTGRRSKLRQLLADPAVTTAVVTHDDRLARMNVEPVQATLAAHGRLYGRGSACNRALKALRCAERNVGLAGATAVGEDRP